MVVPAVIAWINLSLNFHKFHCITTAIALDVSRLNATLHISHSLQWTPSTSQQVTQHTQPWCKPSPWGDWNMCCLHTVTLITVGQMNCKYFNCTLFYYIPIIFLIFNVISVDFCVSHGSSLMFSFGISQICISLIHGRTQNTSASFHRKAELLIQFSCFNRNSGYFGPFGQQGPAIN